MEYSETDIPAGASAKARESNVWLWLKKAIPIFRYDLHMQRVENAVALGVPDTEACLRGISGWLELKSCARPASRETCLSVSFRPEQIPWMLRRTKAGGIVFVLLQVGSKQAARRYLIWPSDAQALADGLHTEEDVAVRSVLPSGTAPPEIMLQRALRLRTDR